MYSDEKTKDITCGVYGKLWHTCLDTKCVKKGYLVRVSDVICTLTRTCVVIVIIYHYHLCIINNMDLIYSLYFVVFISESYQFEA